MFEDATADSLSAASSGTVRSPSSVSDTAAADSAVAAAAVAAAEVCAEGWFSGPRRNSFSFSESSTPADRQGEPMPLFRELQHRLQLEKQQGDLQTKHSQLVPQFECLEAQRLLEDTPSARQQPRLPKEALFGEGVDSDEDCFSGGPFGAAGVGALSNFVEGDSGAVTGRHSSRQKRGAVATLSFDACPSANDTETVVSESATASPGALPKVAPLLY